MITGVAPGASSRGARPSAGVTSRWRGQRRSVVGRIGDRRVAERVVALAALAARTAMPIANGPHARQGQFERHAECRAQPDHVGLLQVPERRLDRKPAIEPERDRPGERREELWRCVRKRVAREWTDHDPVEPSVRAEHGGLREQDEVASHEIDVFVRREVAWRVPWTAQWVSGYTSRMVNASSATGPVRPRKAGDSTRRASNCRSASSHASPTLT